MNSTGVRETGRHTGWDRRSLLTTYVQRHVARAGDQPAFTFIDYGADRHGVARTVTWTEVDRRARALAVRLTEVSSVGERAAILAPHGLEYVVGFLGSLYAGVVAVPLFVPDLPGHVNRLVSAMVDSAADTVLTSSAAAGSIRRFLNAHPTVPARSVLEIDLVDETLSARFRPASSLPDDTAYLQYTSGSTQAPSGVMITHRNAVANCWQVADAFGIETDWTATTWLPFFHDMGLGLTIGLPLVVGIRSVFMDPFSFIMRPARWLRLLGAHPNTIGAAPNFAYDLVAERVSAEEKATLDLSQVAVLMNGSESVRPSSVARFQDAFRDQGLRPQTLRPAYGLAEATVFVATTPNDAPPFVSSFDRNLLAAGAAAPAPPGGRSVPLVSCGSPGGQNLRIVDPISRRELPAGEVGEIWLNGPNVAAGYWRRPEETARSFGASMVDPGADTPIRPWLRTGDYGVVRDGQLYITGRMKELVIIDGRNHYPQDLEATAAGAHPGIRPDRLAAFSVAEGGTERVVIVAEDSRRTPGAEDVATEVVLAVRQAISANHGVRLHDFVLVRPGTVPRTSSGKIQRLTTRQRYLMGELDRVNDQPQSSRSP